MSQKSKETDSRTESYPLSGPARGLRWLGISLSVVGWGIPLVIGILGPVLPRSIGEPIRNCVASINNDYRCIPVLAIGLGLIGIPTLAVSTVYVRKLRCYRLHFILAGLSVTLSIAGMGLAVDSQPPGSALAMFISLTGIFLVPLAFLGIATGVLGLLLLLPIQ